MKSSIKEITTILGTSMGGGFYAGLININGQRHAIIVAPRALGEHDDTRWIGRAKDIPGAKSYANGREE